MKVVPETSLLTSLVVILFPLTGREYLFPRIGSWGAVLTVALAYSSVLLSKSCQSSFPLFLQSPPPHHLPDDGVIDFFAAQDDGFVHEVGIVGHSEHEVFGDDAEAFDGGFAVFSEGDDFAVEGFGFFF